APGTIRQPAVSSAQSSAEASRVGCRRASTSAPTGAGTAGAPKAMPPISAGVSKRASCPSAPSASISSRSSTRRRSASSRIVIVGLLAPVLFFFGGKLQGYGVEADDLELRTAIAALDDLPLDHIGQLDLASAFRTFSHESLLRRSREAVTGNRE